MTFDRYSIGIAGDFSDETWGGKASNTRMDVLGLMAAAEPLWKEACEECSEGESVAIIRAQLELHRHAIDLILERMETS